MREVSDIERRLRATSVDPGVRAEHYGALRADLRHRFAGRRHHRLLMATCLAFFTLVVFKEQPLESYSTHFGFHEVVGDTMAMFKTYDDSKILWGFGRTVDGVKQELSDEEALEAGRKMELEADLYMAGMMELKWAHAYTFRGQTEFGLRYETEHEGETIRHIEIVDQNTDPHYMPFLTGGGFDSLMSDFKAGKLEELPREDVVLDGRVVTFDRWLSHHPEHGEIIWWHFVAVN